MAKARKGFWILFRRLRKQGLRVTVLWMMDHAVRLLKGMSPPRTSRIAANLYVGGQHYRRGLARMARLGISASLSLRAEADDRVRGVALEKHLWLPTEDDAALSVEGLREASAFVSRALAEGRGVYIHCASGAGRAPTVVAAYLVSKGLRPDQAWAQIRRARPFIRPTDVQRAAVDEFHKRTSLS